MLFIISIDLDMLKYIWKSTISLFAHIVPMLLASVKYIHFIKCIYVKMSYVYQKSQTKETRST
jgi:hypothetical protein